MGESEDQAEKKDTPAPSEALPPDVSTGDKAAFVLGIAFFGAMVGWLTGLSASAGTAQALLTSVFTFVAGGLLSFAGFRRRIGKTFFVQVGFLGWALLAFSIPIVGTSYVAMSIRVERDFEWRLKYRDAGFDAPTEEKSESRPSWGLQSGSAAARQSVVNKLKNHSYDGNLDDALNDLRTCYGLDGG